jgi:hypothetical protein
VQRTESVRPLVARTGGSSQENRLKAPLSEFFLSEFAKSSLSPGLEEPKLCFGQGHLRADLFLALLVQVESRQDFAVAAG